MGDPLGLFAAQTAQRPQPTPASSVPQDDPLGLFGSPAAPVQPSTPDLAAGATPAPRRGVLGGIGDMLSGLFKPTLTSDAATAQSGSPDGLGAVPSLARQWDRPATLPIVDRRTVADKQRDAAAGQADYQRRLVRQAAAPDATGTPGTQVVPVGSGETTVARLETEQNRDAALVRSDEAAHSTPQHWRNVAAKGEEYAEALEADGRPEEAGDVRAKAENARRVAQLKEQTDPFSHRVIGQVYGPFGDPATADRQKLAEAEGSTFSPEEQRAMGVEHPATISRAQDASDLGAMAIGQAPWFIAGSALTRGAAGLASRAIAESAEAGGVAARVAPVQRIGDVLGRFAGGEAPVAGPAIPVRSRALMAARLQEETQQFVQSLPRGLTEGQGTMAGITYAQARDQGMTPEQAATAAAEGIGVNAVFGLAAHAALGVTGRAAGLTYDPIGRVFVNPVMSKARELYKKFRAGDEEPIAGTSEVAAELRDPTREAMTAPTPDGQGHELIGLLQALSEKRRQERETGLAETFNDVYHAYDEPIGPRESPIAIPPEPVGGWRSAPPEDTPLRSAADLAMERTRELSPLDRHNATVMLGETARQERDRYQAALDDPNLRLELAAQARPTEQQGPLTLEQTIASAKNKADQGDPMATEYRDAVDKYVDALATVRDVPEGKGASTKAQIALARAKNVLNAARQKYGAQLGGSAVLALAANDDDLTDDEKKLVGLGGLAVLGTEVVKHGEGGAGGERFVSRIARHVESLPKKWDQPTPARTWLEFLGKKGMPYSAAEFDEFVRPALERAIEQDPKTKITREELLGHIDRNRPELKEHRLTEYGRDVAPETVYPQGQEAPEAPDRPGRATGPREWDGDIGPREQALIDEHRDRVQAAQREHDEAAQAVSRRHQELVDTVREHNISDRDFHHALDAARNDDYPTSYDEDAFLNDLREQGALDEGFDTSGAGQVWISRGDDGTDEHYGTFGVHEYRGFSDLHVLAQAEQGGHYSLGGNTDVLSRGERLVYDPESAQYEVVDRDGDRVNHHSVGDTPDEALENHAREAQDWRRDNSDAENALSRDLRDLSEAESEYSEIESATYALREEYGEDDLDEYARHHDDNLHERLEQAREDDAAERTEHEEMVLRGGGDPAYYALDDRDRAFVDRAHLLGAVGTIDALVPEYPERGAGGGRGEYQLVFDPETPHVPLPRPGEPPRAADPHQLTLTDHDGHAMTELGPGTAVVRVEGTPAFLRLGDVDPSAPDEPGVALAPVTGPRTYPGLTGTGQAHWANTQVVPGGRRYRELLLEWTNNPGEQWMGSNPSSHHHWRGTNNVVGSVRLTDRLFYGEEGTTPEIEQYRERRQELLTRLQGIVRSHEDLPADERMNPDSPRVQALLREYQSVNQEHNRIGGYEESARGGLPEREGKRPELVTTAEEIQSDWYQDAMRDLDAKGNEIGAVGVHGNAGTTPKGFRRLLPNTDAIREERTAQQTALIIQRQQLLDRLPDINRAEENARYEMNAALDARRAAHAAWYNQPVEKNFGGLHDAMIAAQISHQDAYARWEAAAAEVTRADQQVRDLNDAIEAADPDAGSVENPLRPPIMPWNDADKVYGVLGGRLLLEAVDADADRVAWSHSSNRMAMSQGFSPAAAEVTYDRTVKKAMTKVLEGFGFKDAKPELITMSGYRWWSIKLSPEMKAAIKRGGVPLLTLVGLMANPDQSEAQDDPDKMPGNAAKPGRPVPWYVTATGIVAASALIERVAKHGLPDLFHGARVAKAEQLDRELRTFYVNPIGPALRQIAKYPSAVALAGLGYLAGESDNKNVKAAGPWVLGLAALSAIGSKRLIGGKNAMLSTLFEQLKKSPEGRWLGEQLNPDKMLAPRALDAILTREQEAAKGPAIASQVARQLESLGPKGDRAVTDLLDNEPWEDVSTLSPAQTTAVLTMAGAVDAELRASEQATLASGAREPSDLLPNYSGKRLYAKYEAEAASHESNFSRRGSAPSPNRPTISSVQHRTLDEPIRQAQQTLHEAIVSGDPQRIQDAEDAVDAATVENYSRRTELGEIREASRRVPAAIQQNYIDAANAKALTTLRQIPGVVHQEWGQAFDDLAAAKQLKKAATTQADRDAAQQLMDQATVKLAEVRETATRTGSGYVALPDTRSWGPMRGAVVDKAVAHELVGFQGNSSYNKALTAWKNIKTKLNPGTHVGNVLSNVGWAHIKGLPVWEQMLPVVTTKGVKPPYLLRAATMMHSYGPGAKELAEVGMIGHGNASEQSGGLSLREVGKTEGLENLLGTTRPETADVLRQGGITEANIAKKKRRQLAMRVVGGAALGAAKGYGPDADAEDEVYGAAIGGLVGALLNGKVRRTITKTYGSEDDIFKVALWLKLVDGGASPQAATKYFTSRPSNFGMGRSRSPVINVLASTTHPFIRWTANALPEFATDVVDHPWRYLTLLGAAAAFNEYADQQEGAIPDSDIPIGQRRHGGYALPGITHLPWTDEQGNKAAVDVSRWTPLSAITTAAPPGTTVGSIDENAPGILQPGGPVVDAAAKYGVNVDPWSGKPFLQRDYPAAENIGTLLSSLAGTALPSALDVHADRLRGDVENRDWSKLGNDALGPTGLKPRYIRPGANVQQAEFELKESLRTMKHDLGLRLRANESPDPARAERLTQQYLRRVDQAVQNFQKRIGAPPNEAIVREAQDTRNARPE